MMLAAADLAPLWVIGGYLSLLLAFSLFSGRLLRVSSSEYFVASRSIGPFLLLMSVFGTTMTAFALVWSTGKAYDLGIGVYGLMALHNHVKGLTRSQESWVVQGRMIDKGQAFVVYDEEAGKVYGGALFYINSAGTGYYASGTTMKGHPGHAMIWNALTQTPGLKRMELGEQVFGIGQQLLKGPGEKQFATKKDVGISLYKRGFSGRTVTRLILEK